MMVEVLNLDSDSSKSGTSTHWEQNLNFPNRKSPTFSKQFKIGLIDQKSSNIAMKNIHKEYIDELADSQFVCKLTAFSIKKKLEEEFEDPKNISKSTITRWLKSDLNYSYKKMIRKPKPSLTHESLTKVMEAATIQHKLYSKGIEVIYVDEFLVNTRNHQFHGWSKRGRKGIWCYKVMILVWALPELTRM